MKNLKISVKLTLCFGIILFLFAISVVISSVSLESISTKMDDFYNKPFRNVTLAIQSDMDSEVAAKYMLRACLETGSDETNEMLLKCNDYLEDMQNNLSMLKESYSGDLSDIAEVESQLSEMSGYYQQYAEMARANDNSNAYALYKEKIVDLLADITESVGAITTQANNFATDAHDTAMASSTATIILIIALGVGAVVFGLCLAFYIIRSIRIPIQQLEKATERMRDGDFDAQITYQSKDELGELADALRATIQTLRDVIHDIGYQTGELAGGNLTVQTRVEKSYVGELAPILTGINQMKSQLNTTMNGINVASDQVNSGSQQVSSAAQALAQGATQQASAVEELAATINDISHQIDATANHAKTAREENENSHRQIEACSSHMDELMKAMSVIDSKSTEISKVIKTIEDIAFQTNILALNAAVEAARAGAAGKGFAVVADEVRNLATKSQEASKSTGTLIEETVKAVAEGTRLSGETDMALREVVSSAQKVLDAVTLISNATEEQSNAVAQITTGIDQISSVVQNNSATAEETAAASEELSGQSHELEGLVSVFTLNS